MGSPPHNRQVGSALLNDALVLNHQHEENAMQFPALSTRRLTGAAALACAAALTPVAALAATPSPAALRAPGLSEASSAIRASNHPQRRQLAVTTLSSFKVVLTATREPGPAPGEQLNATVTAAGYRHTPSGWHLIATKPIGKASQWSWYATEVCSLTVTQLKPLPSSAANSDTITVSLLWGPAIGCVGPYTKSWRP
jgi:hypothetical protein